MNIIVTVNFPDGSEVNDLEASCESLADIDIAIGKLIVEHNLGGYSSLVIVVVPK